MAELAARIEAACEAVGFRKEERPFNAHLTLARVKKLRYPDSVRTLLSTHPEAIGNLRVGAVSLVQSKLSASGPVYTVLKTFELSS
jgi:2'-5' RNA ligase